MRDALALRNDTRAVVRDVKIVRQHQTANHPAKLRVKIHLFEGGSTVSSVKQQLVELRRVLFHHRRDLVVHEVLHPSCLLDLIQRFLTQSLSTHGSAGWHQLLKRLRLELDDGLGQHWMHHAGCTTKGLCALVHPQAQQVQALGVHLLPLTA